MSSPLTMADDQWGGSRAPDQIAGLGVRQAKFVEEVPNNIVQEVLDCLIAVFDDD